MLTLKKEDGPADLNGVSHMAVGVSWDTTGGAKGGISGWLNRKIGTDLDLIAVLMQGKEPVRLAGLDSLDPLGNGAVLHSGDNQTGHGAGDDETVRVDFANVSSAVDSIIFVAAAFKKGSSFEKAANISCKVYDGTGGTETQVADIWPSLLGSENANAVCKATRVGNTWQLEVLNVKGTIRQGHQQSLLHFAKGK